MRHATTSLIIICVVFLLGCLDDIIPTNYTLTVQLGDTEACDATEPGDN